MNETFKSLLNFMQSEDKNGNWSNTTINEADYILETILNWLDDGLTLTPRIQGYINYLGGL